LLIVAISGYFVLCAPEASAMLPGILTGMDCSRKIREDPLFLETEEQKDGELV
jgi:hypothetical protein